MSQEISAESENVDMYDSGFRKSGAIIEIKDLDQQEDSPEM